MSDELNRAAPIAAQLDQDAERAAFEDAYFAEWLKRNAEYDQCREWIFTRVTGDTETYLVIETREAWAGWQMARRAAPVAAQLDAELPPLPEPFMMLHVPAVVDAWKDQMHGYARQVVAPYAERIRLLEREKAERKPLQSIEEDNKFQCLLYHYVNARAKLVHGTPSEDEATAAFRELIAYIDGRTAGTAPEAVSWEWRHRLQGGKGWGAWAKISKGRYDRREDYPNSEFRELFDAAPSPQAPAQEGNQP